MKYIRIKNFDKRPNSWEPCGYMDWLRGLVLPASIDATEEIARTLAIKYVKGVAGWRHYPDEFEIATEEEYNKCWEELKGDYVRVKKNVNSDKWSNLHKKLIGKVLKVSSRGSFFIHTSFNPYPPRKEDVDLRVTFGSKDCEASNVQEYIECWKGVTKRREKENDNLDEFKQDWMLT